MNYLFFIIALRCLFLLLTYLFFHTRFSQLFSFFVIDNLYNLRDLQVFRINAPLKNEFGICIWNKVLALGCTECKMLVLTFWAERTSSRGEQSA